MSDLFACRIQLLCRFLSSFALCLLLSGALAAQGIGFKSYKSYEEYCSDNPKAPTCFNGKPIEMKDFNKGLLYNQPPVASVPRDVRVQPTLPAAQDLQLRADWRFAHRRAELLAGIDVAALRESGTVRELLAKLAAELQISPAELEKALAKTSGIDQVWVSLRSGDLLLLLQGRLELPAGFVKLPNGMTSYRISNSAVVLGKQSSVVASVERLKGSTTPQPPALLKIRELSATNQLWLLGTSALIKEALKKAPSALPRQANSGLAAGSAVAAEVTGFSVGMRLRDGYQMEALIKFASPAAARRLLSSGGGPPRLANSSFQSEGGMKLTSGVEGSSARVTLSIGQTELLRLLEKALASTNGQKLKAMAAAVHKPSAVTIYGSDGQPRQLEGPPTITVPASPSRTMDGITIQGGSQGRSNSR